MQKNVRKKMPLSDFLHLDELNRVFYRLMLYFYFNSSTRKINHDTATCIILFGRIPCTKQVDDVVT